MPAVSVRRGIRTGPGQRTVFTLHRDIERNRWRRDTAYMKERQVRFFDGPDTKPISRQRRRHAERMEEKREISEAKRFIAAQRKEELRARKARRAERARKLAQAVQRRVA